MWVFGNFVAFLLTYLKGIPRSARTKASLVEAETRQEMNDIFDRFAEQTAERELKKEQRKHA